MCKPFTAKEWGFFLGQKVKYDDMLVFRLHGIGFGKNTHNEDYIHLYSDSHKEYPAEKCKPIIRAVEQMTEDEANSLPGVDVSIWAGGMDFIRDVIDHEMWKRPEYTVKELLHMGIDVLDWIEDGRAIKYDPKEHGDL